MTVTALKKVASGAAVAAVAVVLAGCGSSSSSGSNSGGTSSVSVGAGAGSGGASALKTRSTSIGSVLVDSAGKTVYALVGDTLAHELCNSSCEAFWPPVKSGSGIMVVNGHPVFTFVNDSSPGQTHGQNVKDTWGTWLALDAKGNLLKPGAKPAAPTAPASSASGGSSSGGGGYGY